VSTRTPSTSKIIMESFAVIGRNQDCAAEVKGSLR
jgi:hypothetical protein